MYGITLEQYNNLFIEQGGVCAICKKPPRKVRLNVDHDHRFDRVKIVIGKINRHSHHYTALATDPHGRLHTSSATSRAEAKWKIKRLLRRASIRGLLCMSCNKGLQFYRDIPERFDRAAAYLRKFNGKMSNDLRAIFPDGVGFTRVPPSAEPRPRL